MDYSAYQLLWFFLVYAFLGWLGETALAAAKKRRLLNRGFLSAPFSPVYGLAGVLFALFLPELREDIFFLFLFGMILATALELATGVLLERIFRQKWWDYSDEPWNFQGHICLKYSLIWGVLAVICIFFANPLLVRLIDLIPRPVGNLLVWVLLILLTVDFLGSWAALVQLNGELKEPSEISRRWKRISTALDNAVTRSIQRRMAQAYPSLDKERIRTQRKADPVRDSQVFAAGCSFYKLACLFFIGAFLGDIIETIFCRATAGVWMSRSSVVYGPFSIVWGLGAVLLTAVLYRYRDRSDSFVFLFGTVLGGAYEYVCSVFTELVFGTVFWDYSHLPFNLGGRINLLFCFFWGIAAVVWLKLCYPRLSGPDRASPDPPWKETHLDHDRVYGHQYFGFRPGIGTVHPTSHHARCSSYRPEPTSGPALPGRAHGAHLSQRQIGGLTHGPFGGRFFMKNRSAPPRPPPETQ